MNARGNNVTDLEQSVRDLAQTEVAKRKTSSEAIADQAVAIISRANAHVFDEIDRLQAKLNDLRDVQTDKMKRAEDGVRDAMEWAEYVTEAVAKLDSAITTVRGDTAKSV